MARPRKYASKVEIITISIDKEILELIDEQSRKVNKTRSHIITQILTSYSMDKSKFCRIMARKAAQDMHYWKTRLETIESNPELFD